ncbi:MAG: phosphatase PAP2 family protein [Bacteroidetes bacterium]|nr:phosphatase PAP2 family protein [Bacteroidota bacterium]
MLEFLYSVDVRLFFFINHTLANPVLDAVMPVLTDFNKLLPVRIGAVLFILYMLLRGGRNGRTMIGVLVLTIIISDQVNSGFLKELFGRVRPCRALEGVRMLVGCGGGLSFPSSHAVNNFAAAAVIGRYYPAQRYYWLVFAAVIAFSRPYVGVHYPSDILAGSIIGAGIGFGLTKLADRFLPGQKSTL